MINETKKILNDDSIRVTATTVRVPVKYGHCVSINLEFENPFEMDQIYKLLQETEGVIIVDDVTFLDSIVWIAFEVFVFTF